MGFSERSDLATGRDPIRAAADARRAEGREVLDLTCDEPASLGLGIPWERLVPSSLASPTELSLTEALEHYGTSREGSGVRPSRLVWTAGVHAAFDALARVLCDAGEELLVPEPGARRMSDVAEACGLGVSWYPCESPLDGGQPDLAALWETIGSRTRAVFAEHPARPSGAYLSPDSIEALTSLELPWIMDESAWGHVLDQGPLAPPTRASSIGSGSLGFTVDAVETAGLAWIVVHGPDAEAEEAAARLREALRVRGAASRLLERLGPRLVAHRAKAREPAVEAEQARQALAVIRAGLAGGPIDLRRVEGGWLAPLRLPRSLGSSAEQALALVGAGIEVLSGAAFALPEDEAWVVLGLGTPLDDLARGVVRLRDHVRG
jgi:hypothetical protein